jgi:hypothetical protein
MVLTFTSEMTRIAADKAISLVLLLKIGCLFSFCGVLLLVLLLVVVRFIRIVLLYHIGTRSPSNSFSMSVFCPRLLFNIQRANKISDAELFSLMFQRSGKIRPSRWQFGNNASSHKLVGYTHLKPSSSFASD